MLDQERITEIFKESGALLQGHFLLTSGRHSEFYIQCALVLQHPFYASMLGEELALHFENDQVQIVVGPAMGGVIVAHEVARALGTPSLFAEREGGVMALRRGFNLKPGQKVLVVEDVITTGGSVLEVIDLVTRKGGEVVGVGTLVDRSGGNVRLHQNQHSLLSLNVENYAPEQCPMCAANGNTAIKPGSRNI
ncbi:MAG: orotate phosphoribosyltransferase [Bacillota bacterium]